MKIFTCKIIFLVIVFSSFAHHVSAQIYKYQDKDGKIHFTSDPNAIPEGGKILKAFETQEGNKNNPQEENLPENYPSDMEPTIQVLQTVLQLYHATKRPYCCKASAGVYGRFMVEFMILRFCSMFM